jgi:hypothetical protein
MCELRRVEASEGGGYETGRLAGAHCSVVAVRSRVAVSQALQSHILSSDLMFGLITIVRPRSA